MDDKTVNCSVINGINNNRNDITTKTNAPKLSITVNTLGIRNPKMVIPFKTPEMGFKMAESIIEIMK